MLLIAPGLVTVATMSSVALAALARLPIVQTPVPALYAAGGVALTNVSPAGRESATVTDCAVSGPLLVTVNVNVTLDPISGVASFTVFVTATFASGTLTDADAALFAGVGS